MAIELEKIFSLNQDEFRDAKGDKINPKPVGNPLIVRKKLGEAKEEKLILNEIINYHYAGYNINAYAKETFETTDENEILFAVQFYKI